MKFQDLFVPRWQHSNPDVRKKAVARMKDRKLLQQISEEDDDPMVRDAALHSLDLLDDKVRVTE